MAFDQFLPEYFAECEQHLASIRRVLLDLDERSPARAPDAARMQELFRALHTLKGLSGMVGLVSAERLAHALEDALRGWTASRGPFDPEWIHALFTGTGLLEACIAAKRESSDPPPLDGFLASLQALYARSEDESYGDAREAAATAAPPDRFIRYRFEFRPSTDLAARGIGVESVRARLMELGDLRLAVPRVDQGGAIAFEFVVDVPESSTLDEAWRGEGMSWSRDEEIAAPAWSPAESDAKTAPAPAEAPYLAIGNVLRVDVARVDELMRMIGELVVTRARLAEALRRVPGQKGAAWESLTDSVALIERQLRVLREGVMRIRLVQVGELFERMRFAVRELARETGKRVRFEVEGQETEIDKMVIERMLEPLLHLVRNAVSHGIETPEERLARGKPADGRLALSAAASGDRITIRVSDDGSGIDRGRIAARAVELGLLAPGGELDSAALLDVLCSPGFSTREEADLASGRGVGMGVVRSTVRELSGELSLNSEPGRGTTFVVELPLTLMIVDALLVELAGQVMAVPQPSLREVFQLDGTDTTPVGTHEVVAYRGGVLPLLRLRRIFGLGGQPPRAGAVLVVGSAAQPVGLVVDRLLGLREIVVHPLTDPLVLLPGIGGATELGDGRISLVLDAAALVQVARQAADDEATGAPRTTVSGSGVRA